MELEPRSCLKCGAAFVSKKKAKKYCSHACYASRHGTVAKTCETCLKEFTIAYRFRTQKTCGVECAKVAIAKTLTTAETRVCVQCGAVFTRNQYALKHEAAKYCSQACVSAAHRRELVCPTCGSTFSVYASVASKRQFCSKSCAHAGDNNAMHGLPGTMTGKPAWNRGLTNETDERVKRTSEKMSQIISAKIVAGEWTHVKGFISGWHEAPKCGRQFYRSSYERRYFEMLDVDDDVLTYESEPFSIPYVLDGTIKNYTPDVLVTRRDRKQLVEVKPTALLDDPMNVAKSNIAREWCALNDVEYLVVTETALLIT